MLKKSGRVLHDFGVKNDFLDQIPKKSLTINLEH